MKEKFTIHQDDKQLKIHGPWDLDVSVDFDDVDQESVENQAEFLVRLLNKHWK